MFKFLKNGDFWAIIGFVGLLVWQYYMGYAFVIAIVIFILHTILFAGSKEPGDNGAITFIGVGFIPILLLIGLSVWMNQYQTGRMIEFWFWVVIFTFVIVEVVTEKMGKS